MLRRRYPSLLSRYFRVLMNYSHSDSALTVDQAKIKSLMQGDCKRVRKREFQPYFIEKLFLNRFQNTVLEYPEIDKVEEVNDLGNYAQITQRLIADGSKSEVSLVENAVSSLKKYELVGFKMPQIKNGFGYLQSEYTFIQEVLAADPSLSKTVCEQEDFGIYLIDKFGTDLQKDQYLAKLISGEFVASFANIEKETLVSLLQNSFSTSAELQSDNENYVISGMKCWVYNANYADVFIVSAMVKANDGEALKPTLFLINRNTPGVEIHKPIDKIGLKKLTVCDVTFNNVIVPKSSLLGCVHKGDEVVENVLSQGKLSNGGHCIAVMKKFLNRAVRHCIHNEFYHKSKTEADYYKVKVGNMVSRLYVVESMTYLLTGRMDSHENSDVFLESLIVKIFASETLQFIIKETLEILGPDFFSDENGDLLELTMDSQFFIACEDANDYIRLILSTAGLKYTRNYKKNRGVLDLLSDIINEEKSVPFFPKLEMLHSKGELYQYVHLMFQRESRMLEDSVYNLCKSARYLLGIYKDDVYNRHSELKFLADILIDIYAMVATLARGSRAYCIAVKCAETDRLCVDTEVRRCFLRVRERIALLRRPEEHSSKFSKIAPSIMNCNKYSEFCSVLKNLKIR